MAEQQRKDDEGPHDDEATQIVPAPEADDEATRIVQAPETPAADDDATRIVTPPPSDGTRVMPPVDDAPAWAGRAEVRSPAPSAPQGPHGPQQSGGRTWWTPLLLGLLALGLVGIVVLAAWLMTRDNGGPEPTASPTVATTTRPPSPTASPTPPSASPSASAEQLVLIPADLVGMDQDAAANALKDLGLFWNFDYQPSSAPENTVIGSKPAPGEFVPLGSTVTLVIAIDQPPSKSASPSPTTTAGGGG